MATIRETQEQLRKARESLVQQRQQVEEFSPRIELTQQQLRAQTPYSATQMKTLEAQRLGIKQETLGEIETAQEQIEEQTQTFQQWLKTPEGIVAYSREFGIQPKVTYKFEGKSYSTPKGIVTERVRVPVYTYETPYGTYEAKGEPMEKTIETEKRDYPSEVYEFLEEKQKEKVAEAIREGKKVEFTPEGYRISEPEVSPVSEMLKAGEFPTPYTESTKGLEKVWYFPLIAGEYIGKKIYETEKGKEFIIKTEEFREKHKFVNIASQFMKGFAEVSPKFLFFSPAMMTGAAKKKQILKQVEKETPVTSGVRFTDDEMIDTIRNAELSGRKDLIRNFYRDILKTGDKNKINLAEKLLKESLGKNTANIIIKDIKLQEGVLLYKPVKPDIISAGQPATMEKVGEVATSVYAGTGLYEKGKPTDIPDVLLRARQPISAISGVRAEFQPAMGMQNVFLGTAPVGKFKELAGLGIASLSGLASATGVSTAQESALRARQAAAQASALAQALRQQQQLRQQQRLRQQQLLRQVQRARQIPRQIRVPKVPTIPGWPPFYLGAAPLKVRKVARKVLKSEEFQLFVRKKGKDIPSGTFPTKAEAKRQLKNILGGTLRASGFIKSTRTEKKIPILDLTNGMFRPAKRDRFRLVEKRRFRLDMPEEVSTIQKARKKKKNNPKNNFFRGTRNKRVRKINWLA